MTEDQGDCFARTWRNIRLHCRRAVTWRIIQVEATDAEKDKLQSEKAKVNDSTLQKYMVWRRSVLIVSILPVLFSAVMSLAEARGELFEDPYNGLGKLLHFLVLVDNTMLFAGVVVALCFWQLPQKTMTWLGAFWALSVVLPLIPALFPVDYIITSEARDYYKIETGEYIATKIIYAIQYAIFLLPIIITFPAGAWRGALRIRGLFASSSLAGWVLQLSAPFYSIFVLMAFVVIMQLSGNFLLLIGALLLTLSPWIAVARRHLYLLDPTPESDKQLDRTQRIIMINNLIAYTLITIWALSEGVIGNGDTALLTYESGIRMLFEMVGRVLVTTLIFTDRLLRMAVFDWRITKKRRESDGMEDADQMFSSIEESIPRFFGNPKKKDDDDDEEEGKGNDEKVGAPYQTKTEAGMDQSTTARTEEGYDEEVGKPEVGQSTTSFPAKYRNYYGCLVITSDSFVFKSSDEETVTQSAWAWDSVKTILSNKVKDSTTLPKLRINFGVGGKQSIMFTFESRETMERAKDEMNSFLWEDSEDVSTPRSAPAPSYESIRASMLAEDWADAELDP